MKIARRMALVSTLMFAASVDATILNVTGTFSDGGTLSGTIEALDSGACPPLNTDSWIANLTTSGGTQSGWTYTGPADGAACHVSGFITELTWYIPLGQGSLTLDFSPGLNLPSTSQYSITGSEFTFINMSNPGTRTLTSATAEIAAAVPEPTTLALFGIGVAGFSLVRRRRFA